VIALRYGLIFALLCAVPALAQAAAIEDIQGHGVLRVGTTGDYAPFSTRHADGGMSGADIDMARAVAATLRVRVEFVPTAWQTLSADFAAGKFDIAVGGISVTPERAAQGDFSIPLHEDGKRPLARCVDKDRFTSLAAIDHDKIRVIVNPGGTNESFAKANFHQAPITVNADNVSVPDKLATGAADVFVTDGIEADLIAQRFPGVLCPTAVAEPFTRMAKAWWLPKDAHFKAFLDDWLGEAKASGTWRQALDRNMRLDAESR
jgi:cyclohexadienyl dehydratase